MIINFISGPRNISTAVMYSFAQRNDTKVVDEPFYANYLIKTGIDHPGRDETIASQENDPAIVLEELRQLAKEFEVVFLKNMAHHHEALDWSYLLEVKNVFLIRDPKQLIASFAQVIEQPDMRDIGLKHEADLLDFVLEQSEQDPIVVDSNSILENPEDELRSLCEKLEIAFDASMLSWNQGARPEDGSWAKYWYANVHASTGFSRQKTSGRELPERCQSLYQEALPYYDKLAAHMS